MISAFGTPTLLLCGRDEGISDTIYNLAVFSGSSVIMTLEMLVLQTTTSIIHMTGLRIFLLILYGVVSEYEILYPLISFFVSLVIFSCAIHELDL
ncbi:hypothetical protein BJX62DRAFT_216889 [Aspergillus germanicus]